MVEIPWHSSVRLIKSLNNILAIYKPSGLLSHPNVSDKFKHSIIQAPYNFKKEAYALDNQWIYLLNRLDSPTSGVLLLATDGIIAQQIRSLFKQHKVQKTYYALVKGRFPMRELIWKDFLSIQNNNEILRVQCNVQHRGILAQTKVKCLRNFSFKSRTLSYLELLPLTGRTHQLRTQCAFHHFPIVGDKTYGDFNLNRYLKTDRLYLHAKSIKFALNNLFFEVNCDIDFDLLN